MLSKPWSYWNANKIGKKWQNFQKRHILDASSQVGIGVLAVAGWHWPRRTLLLVQVRQRAGVDQRPTWEQSLPHLRILLPQLQNNRDKCIQRSGEHTMLGTPDNLVASPRLPSAQTARTPARAARSNLMNTISRRSPTLSVVYTKFLLHCSLCHTPTTDLAKEMIFLKRIIYGGFSVFQSIAYWEGMVEMQVYDLFFLASGQYLLPLWLEHLKSTVAGVCDHQGIQTQNNCKVGEDRLPGLCKAQLIHRPISHEVWKTEGGIY